jgi:hypothetical protein
MGYEGVFWTEFLRTFAPTLGTVLGLLPVLLLGLGTAALALRLHHRMALVVPRLARAFRPMDPLDLNGFRRLLLDP